MGVKFDMQYIHDGKKHLASDLRCLDQSTLFLPVIFPRVNDSERAKCEPKARNTYCR